MIVQQGTFINEPDATPEEIQRKRETIRQMMGKYGLTDEAMLADYEGERLALQKQAEEAERGLAERDDEIERLEALQATQEGNIKRLEQKAKAARLGASATVRSCNGHGSSWLVRKLGRMRWSCCG